MLRNERGQLSVTKRTNGSLFVPCLSAAPSESALNLAAIARKRHEEEAKKRSEEECASARTFVECQCCYLDVPPNEATACKGTIEHYFCFSCLRKSAETQIRLIKWKLSCFDTSGCQAGFARSAIPEAVGKRLMGKLESLQQRDEVTSAGLEGSKPARSARSKPSAHPLRKIASSDASILSVRSSAAVFVANRVFISGRILKRIFSSRRIINRVFFSVRLLFSRKIVNGIFFLDGTLFQQKDCQQDILRWEERRQGVLHQGFLRLKIQCCFSDAQ